MDLDAFTRPSGRLVKNSDGDDAFVPSNLPPDMSYDTSLTNLIAAASAKLGELSGVGRLLPNPALLILPYLKREAVLSSKIEGTQASLSDLFIYEATKQRPAEYRELRLREVSNYVQALQQCWRAIRKGKKINVTMLKEAHKTLLTGVRGQDANRGQLRDCQVWIGSSDKIADARYVPPPPEDMGELLDALEEFLKSPPDDIPVLVQIALIHYQFEAVHPFIDGNGRIGRLMISLYLCEKGALAQPLLYLSEYLERHNEEYDNAMLRVSQKTEWNQWLKFFLRGVAEHCDEAIQNVQKLLKLKAQYQRKLREAKAPRSSMLLLDWLFLNPYVTTTNARQYLKVSFKTAQKAIMGLCKMGILAEASDKRRNRLYLAYSIRDILSDERLHTPPTPHEARTRNGLKRRNQPSEPMEDSAP